MDVLIGIFFCVVCLNISECPQGIQDLCKQLAPWGQECELRTESLTDSKESSGVLIPEADSQPINHPSILGGDAK